MDSKTIRYQNTRLLVEQVGGVSNFANKINKGQSQTSQFAGTSPIKGIGNKVAREIEEAFGKPYGWLDIQHNLSVIHESVSIPLAIQDDNVFQNKKYEFEELMSKLIYLNSKELLSLEQIKALNCLIEAFFQKETFSNLQKFNLD